MIYQNSTWQGEDFNTKRTFGPEPKYPNVLKAEDTLSYKPLIISGPCQIESEEQVREIADCLRANGIKYMRGGVFSAGTYPGDTFGLRHNDLFMWRKVANEKGLKLVVEIFDVRQIDTIAASADIIQIGARACQNYVLLKEVSGLDRHITLKRGPGTALDEFLGAAEYLCKGKAKPILVERGGASHLNHTRWELSISLIAAVKKMCNLPILVDASHGTGRRDLVESMTYAGIAAGADGCIVECHPNPNLARGADAIQTIDLETMSRISRKATKLYREINNAD